MIHLVSPPLIVLTVSFPALISVILCLLTIFNNNNNTIISLLALFNNANYYLSLC